MAGLRAHVRFVMDHRWAPDQMSAFLEQDLGSRQHMRMERHLVECRQCRRLLAGLRLVLAALRRLPVPAEAQATRIAASVRVRLSEPPSPAN